MLLTGKKIIGLIITLLLLSFFYLSIPPNKVIIYVAPGGTHLDTAEIYKPKFAERGLTLVIKKFPDITNIGSHVGKETGEPTIGFSGTAVTSDNLPNVRAAGVTTIMPMFIFVKSDFSEGRLSGLYGEHVCLPPSQSITTLMALDVLEAYGVSEENSKISFYSLQDLLAAMKSGECDAGIIILSTDSQIIKDLTSNSTLSILDFPDSRAITTKVENTEEVVIPVGAFDSINQLPSKNIHLIGVPNTVIFREDLDPEIINLLLQTMKESHASATMVTKAFEFPKPAQQLLTEDDTVKNFYENGLPWSSRVLPFWLSSLVNKYSVVLVFLISISIALNQAVNYFNWSGYLLRVMRKRKPEQEQEQERK